MLPSSAHRVLSLALTAFLAGPPLFAQPSPCGATSGTNVVWGAGAGRSFTATIHVSGERRLYDGNVIRTDAVVHQSRDSSGRVRSESVGMCDIDENGNRVPVMRISISDPNARTYESWMEGRPDQKTAEINHYAIPDPPSKEERDRQYARAKAQLAAHPVRTEKLGTKMIAGVLAEGTRTTSTVPAGDMGNDRPLETVEEHWVSRGAGIVLSRTIDSPMAGHQSLEVTSITFVEPDAKLFAPPEDYKVVDTEPKVVRTAAPPQNNGQ